MLKRLWQLQEAFGNPTYKIKDSNYREKILEHPTIKQARVSDPYLILVNNSQNWQTDYVTGDPVRLTGYSEKEILKNQNFLFQFTHPDDMTFITSVVGRAMKYTLSRPQSERKFISVVYFYRAWTKNKKPLVVSHESIPIVFDDNGIPFTFCNIISDLTFLGVSNVPQASIINHFSQDSLLLDNEHEAQMIPSSLFTKRELEIIDLLLQGNNSRSISDKLFISAETVRTHRKNILKKAKVHSTTELIMYVLGNGITT